ncbi:MAG TPA: cupin domain-containing protein [Acetobacteraceae bacterium]|jgi:quercetin dioxygenase-like cupin family protein
MERAEFEAALSRDGYEIVNRGMPANQVNPEHAHDFDARVLVTEGEIKITFADGARTYAAGDWCEVPAGRRHAEEAGPRGVSYVAGRRQPA